MAVSLKCSKHEIAPIKLLCPSILGKLQLEISDQGLSEVSMSSDYMAPLKLSGHTSSGMLCLAGGIAVCLEGADFQAYLGLLSVGGSSAEFQKCFAIRKHLIHCLCFWKCYQAPICLHGLVPNCCWRSGRGRDCIKSSSDIFRPVWRALHKAEMKKTGRVLSCPSRVQSTLFCSMGFAHCFTCDFLLMVFFPDLARNSWIFQKNFYLYLMINYLVL